jgi:hypothetical protein
VAAGHPFFRKKFENPTLFDLENFREFVDFRIEKYEEQSRGYVLFLFGKCKKEK